jgi:hypothetical protein
MIVSGFRRAFTDGSRGRLLRQLRYAVKIRKTKVGTRFPGVGPTWSPTSTKLGGPFSTGTQVGCSVPGNCVTKINFRSGAVAANVFRRVFRLGR